ncbi:MAG: prolyl aminopeptidase [Gammaproteobacteria bacterium]|nr:prolyl aminopeptidase [Gammaproteobacteria bacterium]MCW8986349.1 prolyl aminopeptidase [Gammaproteobacteria bacterium]MCW9031044.1 prolyl aminopeptidase [Gammaproteobacteria bacterium]
MRNLYPDIKPYKTHHIKVDEPHVLYVEESGNPEGLPVLFVHGGPGAGCEAYHRRFFDPNLYRIILFDQRGAGRSTPHAELKGNTTQDLVADMEIIREQLDINRWVLFGGSWGSTLSLVYAETHVDRVMGLIVRGIFLCRKKEINWFYQQGADCIFPDYWQDFISPIPVAERGNLLKAYYQRLTGENEIAQMQAAKAWSIWEGRTATLKYNKNVVDHFGSAHTALSLARIESHYFIHDSFLEENQILNNANKLQNIPGVIVQGRYDLICPLESAWQLHKAWPKAELKIIADAGHSATEPGTIDALINATNEMLNILK